MANLTDKKRVRVIGGGLAGTEAAYFLANHGLAVDLCEMRPVRGTEAHKTGDLAELVCSNSFKSLSPVTAPGILKQEMELLGSLSIRAAKEAQVGAGEALAVDREIFARFITKEIESHPNITVLREEVSDLSAESDYAATIVATGPLTSPALSESIQKLSGEEEFYFYDAISPVIQAESINYDIAFFGNRHGKESRFANETNDPRGDYLNCPLNKEEYETFLDALDAAEKIEAKSFERLKHFEGCMPIEEMLRRGRDTLRFGPMRPIGFDDPRTGRWPHALVQLRAENRERSSYNMVGFQTRMKYGAQKDVFRLIPGLEDALFYRLGSMHRNAFVNAPKVLADDLSLKAAPSIFFAGQVTGVEGYMESASIGMLTARFVLARLRETSIAYPSASAIGALYGHLRNTESPDFQPMGINFGLFSDNAFEPVLAPLRKKFFRKKKIPKADKRAAMSDWSISQVKSYANTEISAST